jgi:hypothetical protein
MCTQFIRKQHSCIFIASIHKLHSREYWYYIAQKIFYRRIARRRATTDVARSTSLSRRQKNILCINIGFIDCNFRLRMLSITIMCTNDIEIQIVHQDAG